MGVYARRLKLSLSARMLEGGACVNRRAYPLRRHLQSSPAAGAAFVGSRVPPSTVDPVPSCRDSPCLLGLIYPSGIQRAEGEVDSIHGEESRLIFLIRTRADRSQSALDRPPEIDTRPDTD